MTLEAVHAGIVVTVRGRPVTVKMVICSGPERQELRQPGEHRLREFIAKSGLHQAGDGEMFVCFVEQAAGAGSPDLGRAEPIAIVHERDAGGRVLRDPAASKVGFDVRVCIFDCDLLRDIAGGRIRID